MMQCAAFLLLLFLSCFRNAAAAPPAGGFNARDFGAKGDSVALDSDATNRAIAAAAKAGGGTVYFPGGKIYKWNNWADVLEPQPGTAIWATCSNQFYSGKAAVISRKLGKGTVTYVGPDTDDGALEKELIRRVYEQVGIGEVTEWQGHSPEQLNAMKERLERLKQLGIEAIED